MTSSITPITAASKGGTTESSTEGTPAKPERGVARLRETEVYHLTSLVESALNEAEHLVRQAQDNTSEPLNAEEISRLLSEAYQCTTMAAAYIDKAVTGLLDGGGKAPF
jgi:hypothetical protein